MTGRDAEMRLLDLMVDEATEGLDEAGRAELEALRRSVPEVDRGSLQLLAADLTRVFVPVEETSLPAGLPGRVEADAERFVADRRREREASAKVVPLRRRSRWMPVVSAGGWLAAAAAWLLVVRGPETAMVVGPATPAAARAELLTSARDVMRLDWAATEDPAAEGASGDVVWSPTRQQGFMRFRGLAANDPTRQQYQLWIFDAERDERYPVDGGVFDVPAGSSEVVVPIEATLPIAQPTLFAITVERPGGVVVSTRERLPLLARVGA